MKAISAELHLSGFTFKDDDSLSFRATTAKELTDEEAVAFSKLKKRNVRALFEPIDEVVDEVIQVKSEVSQKTQSSRIRSCLYLIWKQEGEIGRFEDYYHDKTEKYINYLKEKLE